ncbi:amino acid oxidase [Aliidiomarina sedimenti]|uniref:Amino acid oxidase n=1 Tax=Aliidiomarina sedimenti TaxID=1933879 RepID=A0ABY0BXU5_9GAMM|nr:FAD-dependent oxidoreductase [Aliidiomarina sedimenti]RUO29002.1 amino acid oxidase [Aliidiomarina sedimenti]
MDLKSGLPFWAIKNGLMHQYPTLQENLKTQIVIMGGGITGALLADHFSEQGYQVAVADRREIGWGSSAASTALLQYEIDVHMCDLAKDFGEHSAYLAYQGCADAITTLRRRTRSFSDLDFAMQDSLYFASRDKDVEGMLEEYQLRRKHGFDAKWLEHDELQRAFGIDAPAAILTPLAARIDPYRTAHKLHQRVLKRGGKVYERTEIATFNADASGVSILTKGGHRIDADHLIIASGYESQQYLTEKIADNRSSYAFVTDPISKAALGPLADTMVWESARPYLYMRATGDGRLVIGGEDDDIDIPARRDTKVAKKAKKLADKLQALFPRLEFSEAFAWAGTFAETKDGLPFFGPHPSLGPRIHFAMAYGGNGISYSVIGCDVLQAWIEQSEHDLKELFSFDRRG